MLRYDRAMSLPRIRLPRFDVGVVRPSTLDPNSDEGIRQRVADVREGYRAVQAGAYAIGKELVSLKKQRAQRRFKLPTFQQLVTEEMKIPYRTAARYMRVARHFKEETAVEHGISKCEQVIRLHAVLADKRKYGRNPSVMLSRNPRFGKGAGKTLKRMTAKEVEALVRAIELRKAAALVPAPTPLQTRMLARLRKEFEGIGLAARTRFHPGRNEFTAVFAFDEVREHFR